MTDVAAISLSADEARSLEAAFLDGLDEAQSAYEQIVAAQAWLALGFDSLGTWWDERIRPAMRALSMRPTKEIAAAVVEQVRAEEAELPSAWRRREHELADMVGASPDEIRNRAPRSTSTGIPAKDDLDAPAMPARQDDADEILAAIDAHVASAPPAERPKPMPWTPDEQRESERRAAVNNLRSVLTYLVSTAIAPAELARDYAIALDEFKRDDLDFAAATMAAIADLKEQ